MGMLRHRPYESKGSNIAVMLRNENEDEKLHTLLKKEEEKTKRGFSVKNHRAKKSNVIEVVICYRW